MRKFRYLLLVLAMPALVAAQSRDINEALIRVPVSVPDHDGRTINADIPVTLYRPEGDGPFPLVLISHGRAADPGKRAEPRIQRFESAARFFVRKGFAVAVPTRLGYGEVIAAGDPERSRGPNCNNVEYTDAMRAGAAQVLSVVARLRQEPWVDARRLVLVGQSVGGFVTVATAAARPAGLVAAINFAGGSGGNPETHPGVPCSGDKLAKAYADFGASAQAPMLWIYTENDQYFNPQYSRAWHAAFTQAGGQASYRLLPAFGQDGHLLFARGNDIWQPVVDDYLARFGFTQPGTLTAITNGQIVRNSDSRIPYLDEHASTESVRAFLAAKTPRALAIAPHGAWGWASGDDSMSRALASCQGRTSTRCKLYAVDDAVVWQEPSSASPDPR